jgi:hypothetical protein
MVNAVDVETDPKDGLAAIARPIPWATPLQVTDLE